MPVKKILVTGSTGFLGRHVVKAFFSAGYGPDVAVYADYRSKVKLQDLLATLPDVRAPQSIFFDLARPDSISAAVSAIRPDIIIHCAAYGVNYAEQDCAEAIQVNVSGTAALVAAAAEFNVQRFVNLGTSYEYGECDLSACPAPALKPLNLYGSSKAAQTIVVMERGYSLGLPVTTLRPFSMFGPGEGEHKFVPQVALACIRRQPLELTAGEQLRNYLYVEDVARAIVGLCFAERFPQSEILDLYGSNDLSIKTFGNLLAKAAGAPVTLLRWGARPYRNREIMKNTGPGNCSPWIEETPIEQAMAATLAWVQQHSKRSQA